MRPTIKPIGVGDLKVVKQKLARYEAGEIAHIENIMARESHSREHRRLRQFEEILELEQERLEESLRDLQSTERFEMQNESQRTIRSETSFQAGLDVSAGYGPVSISAFAKFNTSTSKEESDRNSTKYAKDVTEKTLARLVEKVREERRARTLEETEETNKHGFDNTSGGEHVVGIYRWVDKYYRAKVVNYGKRLMYEFFIPEPAAFFIFATQHNLATKVLPNKPDPPTAPGTTLPLKPSDISRTNYLGLVQQFDAQGVQPPPPEWIVITKAMHREFPNTGHWAFSNDEFKIPKGYVAVNGIYAVWYTWQGDPPQGDPPDKAGNLLIGVNRIDIDRYPPLTFNSETGSIPVAGAGYEIRTFALNVEASCRLVAEFFAKWQLETYTAIMAAYHKALMDYEERVAAAQIAQGVAIGGDNPEINRQIEKLELKRACLTLWSGQRFLDPAGIDHTPDATPPGNYPEINLAHATTNATAIEFFEQAFEWKNITYEFLPYFWGRKARWIDTLSLENPDPIFEQFLRSGAARVVVPVNPTHVEAVLYYQLTGVIWTGGPVPPLTGILDPDAQIYNSYVEELADVEELPDIDQEVEIDADDETTWLIKVPTTLVWLQGDKTLPKFED
jgi:hypothetical protein